MQLNISQEDLKSKFGIYAIRCTSCGKVYIGQTRKPFKYRINEHIGCLHKGLDSSYLQRSFNKYGTDAFEIVIQEKCPITDNASDECTEWLNKRETFWIKYYRRILGERNVFNLNDGGDGKWISEETREKLSIAGKRRYEKDPDARKKQGEYSRNAWKNNRESRVKKNRENNQREDVRKKNSEVQKKRWSDQETHKRLKEVAQKCFSNKEHGKKTSAINKERWQNEEVRRKHQEATKKHWSTQEAHDKRKEQIKKMWAKPENRKKILELHKARKRKRDYVVDCILHNVYIDYPHLQNLCKSKKFYLIERIAKLHS